MEGNHTDTKESTGEFYGCLETYARQHLQAWLQDLLEQEVADVLGRGKHERKLPGGEQAGDRNGGTASRGGVRAVWARWRFVGRGCAT